MCKRKKRKKRNLRNVRNLCNVRNFIAGSYASTPVEAIPGWVFGIMDMLEELEDSATVSILKVDMCFVSVDRSVQVETFQYFTQHRLHTLPSRDQSALKLDRLGRQCNDAEPSLWVRSLLALMPSQHLAGNTLPSDFSTKFFAEQFDKTDWSWQNTRLMDYGIPTTEPAQGENLSAGAYLRWYITKLQRLAITVGVEDIMAGVRGAIKVIITARYSMTVEFDSAS
ncbi:hypothetical protein B0H10DRAFT_1966858 [Mycena sp. CBHHK59/15]|nr:hypothetical protein B0H10DRAFT_1966858 [Mycena sp. CBHHK59/15]